MLDTLFLPILLSLAIPKDTLRFQYVHEQGFDSSCGLSSASTVLDVFWGESTSEIALIARLSQHYDGSEDTVSFAQISDLLQMFGVHSRGYRMDYDQLAATLPNFSPIIVHYDSPDDHFAIALSASDKGIIVADPAHGLRWLPRRAFEHRWSRATLVTASDSHHRQVERITDAIELKRKQLNLLERWW